MTRTRCLALGFITLLLVWALPLGAILPGAFSAHMTMHMGVVAVAAPLLSFGVAGGRFDPARRWPALFPPIGASIIELLVVWAWHAPVLHHAARHVPAMVVLEQGSFLASGLWVWLAAFGGPVVGRSDRGALGVVALLLTSMHMTLLGALLALPPRPLYAHHGHVAGGISALDDQHLGGAIMLVVGGISYLGGGLWLSVELLRSWRHRRTDPSPHGSARAVEASTGGDR